ncbi:hypothetical protein ACFY36_50635 [Actinoplanes sp. NPDC000266]
MAGKRSNEMVQRLRERHAAQERAVVAVAGALGAVQAAQRRRESALSQLDAAVVLAEGERDEAVAVLARLSSAEETAELVGLPVAEVRRAVQRVPNERVREMAGRWRTQGERRRGHRGGAASAGSAARGSAGGEPNKSGDKPDEAEGGGGQTDDGGGLADAGNDAFEAVTGHGGLLGV